HHSLPISGAGRRVESGRDKTKLPTTRPRQARPGRGDWARRTTGSAWRGDDPPRGKRGGEDRHCTWARRAWRRFPQAAPPATLSPRHDSTIVPGSGRFWAPCAVLTLTWAEMLPAMACVGGPGGVYACISTVNV